MLFHADFREVLDAIPPGSVDAVITDPPYGSGGFTARDTMRSAKDKYVSTDASYQQTLPDIDGDCLHPKAWEQLMLDATQAARRVLRDGGVLVMFIDWRNKGTLQNVIAQAALTLRGTAVWDKGPGTRPFKNGMRNQAEYLVWASKGPIAPRDPTVYLPGVFRHTTKTGGKRHITEKPLALMEELVAICLPGGTIWDPFMGSATTGVAALRSGRRFIGCESVAAIFDDAAARMVTVR